MKDDDVDLTPRFRLRGLTRQRYNPLLPDSISLRKAQLLVGLARIAKRPKPSK